MDKFLYNSQFINDEILTKSMRDGLICEVHRGFLLLGDKDNIKYLKGDANLYPFYLRSCAKPLQAVLIIDWGMDEFYNMTQEEIALCCASHAGEKVHTDIIKGLLNKIRLDEGYLKCGLHEPLSKTRQYEMKLNKESLSPVYNNCSGKHTMMLGLCKMKELDLTNYYDINHPLQIAIKKRVNELCEVKKDYPITKDGCGVPIFSMPLENILKGYLNLFCNDKYKKIRDAFVNCPYLIGGEDRTDSKIIHNAQCTMHNYDIIAKVGADGLCVVINTIEQKGFLVKISDCDMKSRELVVFEMLNKLKWANIDIDKLIKTLHGDVVGFVEVE